MRATLLTAASLLVVAAPAVAGNRLVPAHAEARVARSDLIVTPSRDWNRLGFRPGRSAETWTLDGDALNRLTFYGAVADGQPIFREVDRRNRPLPRFSSTMLLTDIPTLVENSYRAGRNVSVFTVEGVEPVPFAGQSGVRFSYTFVGGDDVRRRGEGQGAIIGGRLYLATFEAPVIHYFDASVEAARQILGTAAVRAGR